MRIAQYLITKNLGLETLIQICQYLNFDKLNLNSQLSDCKMELIEKTLNDDYFEDWLKLKMNLQRIEKENAKLLFKNLYYYSTSKIDDEVLAERIINALSIFKKNRFKSILEKNITIFEKIEILRKCEPFVKPEAIDNNRYFERRIDDYFDYYQEAPYCEACQESPCMCSDPEKTSTTLG